MERARTRGLCWGDTAQVAVLRKEFPDGFEVILGADVLYVAEAIGPLLATIRELLAASPGVRNTLLDHSCPLLALPILHPCMSTLPAS